MGGEVRLRRMSTSAVAVPDRFAFWEALLSSSMFPVRLRPADTVAPRRGPTDFRAEFLQADSGTARITSGVLDPVRGESTAAQARQRDAGTVQLMLHAGGRLLVESRQGRQVFTEQTVLVQTDDELTVHTHSERVRMLVLSVSAAQLSLPVGLLRPMMFVPLPVDAGVRALLSGAIDTARRSTGSLDAVGMNAYLTGIAELVLRTVAGRQPDHAGTVAARRIQACDVVCARLGDPHLNAAVVAEAIGVTVRRLHQLFRGGPTVAEQIRHRRMELGASLLRDPMWAAQPVSAVARRCGYLDQSQFARSFRRHTGTTPTGYRA